MYVYIQWPRSFFGVEGIFSEIKSIEFNYKDSIVQQL